MKKWLVVFILLCHVPVYALSPTEIQEAYQKSFTYEKLQDYDNAIKSLAPVYKEYSDTYTVNLRLGWVYYLNQKYANSIEHYQKAIKIASSSVEAKLGYMLPLMAQARYKEAETVADQILNADYYNYYGNLRLCYALRLQEKYDLAEKVANKMLTHYPTDVQFLTELALCKHGQGKKDLAAAIFWDVIVLDPENVTARDYLQLSEKKS